MARWPDVPAVTGRLRLDRRGDWFLQDRKIAHPNSLTFIAANYESDRHGRFFFQNGPQRVFVDLDLTPWVYRAGPDGTFTTHTRKAVTQIIAVYIEGGNDLYLETEHGIGIVHDGDLNVIAGWLNGEGATLTLNLPKQDFHLQPIQRDQLPARFGFVQKPRLNA